jgi:hypothetical protein
MDKNISVLKEHKMRWKREVTGEYSTVLFMVKKKTYVRSSRSPFCRIRQRSF